MRPITCTLGDPGETFPGFTNDYEQAGFLSVYVDEATYRRLYPTIAAAMIADGNTADALDLITQPSMPDGCYHLSMAYEVSQVPPADNLLMVHYTHCNQGDYLGSCKYGDDDCPALKLQNDHREGIPSWMVLPSDPEWIDF